MSILIKLTNWFKLTLCLLLSFSLPFDFFFDFFSGFLKKGASICKYPNRNYASLLPLSHGHLGSFGLQYLNDNCHYGKLSDIYETIMTIYSEIIPITCVTFPKMLHKF